MEGLWTIFGPILTVVLALLTKNVIISLFFGVCYFSVGLFGLDFLNHIVEFFVAGVNSNGFILVTLVPLGVLLAFMRAGGGFKAFAAWANKKVSSRKQVGVMVFFLSTALAFAQDLVANLATGRILRPVILEKKLAPEKSAFISLSAAPNIGAPIPYGTYFLFCIGMIAMLVPEVAPIPFFLKSLCMSFHTWLAVLIGLLLALEIIPDLGYMKECQKRALEAEVTAAGEDAGADETLGGADVKPDFGAFFLPIFSLVAGVAVTSLAAGELTMIPGFFIGAFVAVFYTLVRKSVKPKDVGDLVVGGIMEQTPILILLAFAFAFGAALQMAGLDRFIVTAMSGTLPPALVPVIVFLIGCLISYPTGSLGSGLVIMLPIAMPLGIATGANLLLTFAATFSGAQWGDQLSPLSDMVIENAGANSVDPVDLFRCALPYRLIEGGISLALFLVLGLLL